MKSIFQWMIVVALTTASAEALCLTTINVHFSVVEPSYHEFLEPQEIAEIEAKAAVIVANALSREFQLFEFKPSTVGGNDNTLFVMLDRLRSSQANDIQPISLYWSWIQGDKDKAKWAFYSSAEFIDLDYEAQPFYDRLSLVMEEGNYQQLQESLLVKIPVSQQGTFMPDKSGAKPGWQLSQSHRDLCLHPDSVLIVNSKWMEIQRKLEADVVIPNSYDEHIFGEIRDVSALNQISGIDPNNPAENDSVFVEAFVFRYAALTDCSRENDNDGNVSPLMVGR